MVTTPIIMVRQPATVNFTLQPFITSPLLIYNFKLAPAVYERSDNFCEGRIDT
ncbi:hypothetical protein IF1G_03621 [Cordyceps javanica]|uniref:Uncharacterized protein n=1 Tax=Cordyceps javanica TaxID=43265 RepID=A0A545V838_9HYPO|nr:hypothetical protein IF1G_03621 [Cordyceps javanica]